MQEKRGGGVLEVWSSSSLTCFLLVATRSRSFQVWLLRRRVASSAGRIGVTGAVMDERSEYRSLRVRRVLFPAPYQGTAPSGSLCRKEKLGGSQDVPPDATKALPRPPQEVPRALPAVDAAGDRRRPAHHRNSPWGLCAPSPAKSRQHRSPATRAPSLSLAAHHGASDTDDREAGGVYEAANRQPPRTPPGPASSLAPHPCRASVFTCLLH